MLPGNFNVQQESTTSSSEPSDGALVGRVLAGERSAFDVLIGRYQRQVVAVAYRYLGNTQDALEVAQDTFLKGFTSIKTLQKPEAFGGWLMRITSNLSLNFRRSRRVRSQLPLDDLLAGGEERVDASATHGGGDPLRAAEGHELGQRLSQALAELPEKQRMALILFTIEQLPQKEVAETLGCSVEAVKWHVFQGRKKLRELLKDHV